MIRSPRDVVFRLYAVMAVMVTSWSAGLGVGDLGKAALSEDLQAEVAALLGLFVMLLGEYGADEADQ